MNIRRSSILIAAVSFLFYTGCKKEKTDTYYVKATIDGQYWAADSIIVSNSPLPDVYPVLCRATHNGSELIFSIPPPALNQEILFESHQPTDIQPGTLISFTLSSFNSDYKINWQTGTELNLDKFIVEISNDGINWSESGIVEAVGSGGHAYEYLLRFPFQLGIRCYARLKLKDDDGKFIYSSILTTPNYYAASFKPANADARGGYSGFIRVTARNTLNRTVTGTFEFRISLINGGFTEIKNGEFFINY